MSKRTSAFFGFVFLVIVVMGGTIAGLAVFDDDDDSNDGNIGAFCAVRDGRIENPEGAESSEELLIYYTRLLNVAPRAIRDEVQVLQNSERNINELQDSEDLAALFFNIYRNEDVEQSRTQLDNYFESWC